MGKAKATKPGRASALSKHQAPPTKKKKKSGSRQKGSASHSRNRKTRHSSGFKPAPLKPEMKSLPPKSGLNTSKHKSQASRQLPPPALPQSEVKHQKPLSVLNEILKESTDSKFLEVIDNLRELRKKNCASNMQTTRSNRVFWDSTKSNRNLKTEIEFESAIVELINCYNKCMGHMTH